MSWHDGGVDEEALRGLLDDLTSGRRTADDVVSVLRRLPFAEVGEALVDHHRALRQGIPEAVYGPGKTPEQCARIVGEMFREPDAFLGFLWAGITMGQVLSVPMIIAGLFFIIRARPDPSYVPAPRRRRKSRRSAVTR